MASCFGASSQGTLTQLVSLGAMDKFLSQNPTITLWRFRYAKHTHFVFEPICQSIVGARFGAEVQVSLNRTGDLLHFAYLQITIPGIVACLTTVCRQDFQSVDACDPCGDGLEPNRCDQIGGGCTPGTPSNAIPPPTDPEICTGLELPYCHWVNAIGQYIAERVSVVIGGQVIDTMYNDYLFMWEELAGQPGKRLQEMIGKRFTVAQLVADSKHTRTLYVPLPFWFTYNTGNALALVSLQFHTVQIIVQLAQLRRCIQLNPLTEQFPLPPCVLNCDSGAPVQDSDMTVNFEGLYVYLDRAERDRFAASSFEQLMNAVQRFSLPVAASGQVHLAVNFNHPVIELIWAARRRCQWEKNNHFNYAGKYNRDPIDQVQLILNGNDRFSRREGRYFRLVIPYQWHTLIPDNFIYSFSFATEPEKMQPTGSCNFSRIDNAEFVFAMQHALISANESVETIVFARNWQIFKYRQGLGGVAFANRRKLEAAYSGPALLMA